MLRSRRAASARRTVRVALLLAGFLYALPGVAAWAITLRKQAGSDVGLLLFSALFAAAPLVTVVLLSVSRRLWLVSLVLPTTVLAVAACCAFEQGSVQRAFMAATALVAVAGLRALVAGVAERRARADVAVAPLPGRGSAPSRSRRRGWGRAATALPRPARGSRDAPVARTAAGPLQSAGLTTDGLHVTSPRPRGVTARRRLALATRCCPRRTLAARRRGR